MHKSLKTCWAAPANMVEEIQSEDKKHSFARNKAAIATSDFK